MIAFTIPVRTTNPNNGATGNSKLAAIIRGRTRKHQRELAGVLTLSHTFRQVTLPVVVTVTRVAPSKGLDPHDGLGAALKGVIDGIADGLGLKDDRSSQVTWRLAQCRGPRGRYEVRVAIEAVSACAETETPPGALSVAARL